MFDCPDDLKGATNTADDTIKAKYPSEREETPLVYAVERGSIDAMRLLVESGADVNAPNKFGTSVLMRAVASGSVDVVRFLVEAGADVNAPDA